MEFSKFGLNYYLYQQMHILIVSVFSCCCCCPLVLYVVAADLDADIFGCQLSGSAVLLNHMAAFVYNTLSCIFL